jgi:hypothetical protein
MCSHCEISQQNFIGWELQIGSRAICRHSNIKHLLVVHNRSGGRIVFIVPSTQAKGAIVGHGPGIESAAGSRWFGRSGNGKGINGTTARRRQGKSHHQQQHGMPIEVCCDSRLHQASHCPARLSSCDRQTDYFVREGMQKKFENDDASGKCLCDGGKKRRFSLTPIQHSNGPIGMYDQCV